MSREMLFKAKRLDNGEWVEGSLISTEDNSGFILRSKTKAFIPKGTNTFCSTECYEIDPDTLCQFTGLTDKNGEKIWENDICDRKEKYPEIVTYNKGDWQLDYSYVFGKEMHTDACNLGFYVCERDCVEVIGNIFDNVDLLEAKQ